MGRLKLLVTASPAMRNRSCVAEAGGTMTQKVLQTDEDLKKGQMMYTHARA